MWSMLEESLISCHKIRSATFQQPRGKVTQKCEEAPQNSFTGCAETEATIAATRRKRILQQLLALNGRQDRTSSRASSDNRCVETRSLSGQPGACCH